jgi:hypothetical protein
MRKTELDGFDSRSQDYASVIMNNISNRVLSAAAGLLLSLSTAACGDDDQVNPSNPDASAVVDAKSDAPKSDSGSDAAKDGAKEGTDAAGEAHPEAGETKDSATGSTDAEGDAASD